MLGTRTPYHPPLDLQQRVRERPSGWVPGELVVAAAVDAPPGVDPVEVLRALRADLAKRLGPIPIERPDPENDVPLLFPLQGGERSVLFARLRLVSTEPPVMREAIAALDSDRGLAATPTWFRAAQQDCCGGRPSNLPVPVGPFGSPVRPAPHLQQRV